MSQNRIVSYSTLIGKTLPLTAQSLKGGKKKGKAAKAEGLGESSNPLQKKARTLLLRGGYLRESPPVLLPLGNMLVSRIESRVDSLLASFQEVRLGRQCIPLVELPKLFSPTFKDLPMCIYKRLMNSESNGITAAQFEGAILHHDAEVAVELFDSFHEKLSNVWAEFGLKVWNVSDVNGRVRYIAESGSEMSFFHCVECNNVATATATRTSFEPFIQDGEDLQEMHDVLGENITGVYPLAEFLGIDVKRTTKTIIFQELDGPRVFAAFIRGDHEVDARKLANSVEPGLALVLAEPETVVRVTGCVVGYAGIINLADEVNVVADFACKDRVNIECGANREHYHTLNANPGRDFVEPVYADLRSVKVGDCCAKCGNVLQQVFGTDIGGYCDVVPNNDVVVSLKDSIVPLVGKKWHVDCVKIVEAIAMASLVNDASVNWPVNVAPFSIAVIDLMDHERAAMIAEKMMTYGNVLLDDRSSKIQRKMNDCDLVGVSVRVVVGSRMDPNMVEMSIKGDKWTDPESVTIDEACNRLPALFEPFPGWSNHPMTPSQLSLFRLLAKLSITTFTYHHSEVLTCDAHARALPHHDSATELGPYSLTKALLVKDKKKQMYLVVALADTTVDFKTIAGGVRLANPGDVQRLLGVPVGHVTPFALLNAPPGIGVVLDDRIRDVNYAGYHPLQADSTTVIAFEDLTKFIEACGFVSTSL